MPRQKKQQLKRRKDGRYCCKYKGIQFIRMQNGMQTGNEDENEQKEKTQMH